MNILETVLFLKYRFTRRSDADVYFTEDSIGETDGFYMRIKDLLNGSSSDEVNSSVPSLDGDTKTAGIRSKENWLSVVYGLAIFAVAMTVIIAAAAANGGISIAGQSNVKSIVADNSAETVQNTFAAAAAPAASGDGSLNDLYTVTLKADGKIRTVRTTGDSVADALRAASVELGKRDVVKPAVNTALSRLMSIEVTRDALISVKVKADGKVKEVLTEGGKVADALNSADITLDGDDKVKPASEASLTEGMNINVTRISTESVTKEINIPYETKTKKSASLARGTTSIEKKGRTGVKEQVYVVKKVDGKEVSKKLVSESVTRQPVTEVKVVGTKAVQASAAVKNKNTISNHAIPSSLKLDSNGIPINYKKKISGPATAYCDGTTTSTGRPAMPGNVAVNPNVIPYGTKMYIVSKDGRYNYGYAVAADTGGALMSGAVVVDLYFYGNAACEQFGRRAVDIYIL